jgi:hypothetical protein
MISIVYNLVGKTLFYRLNTSYLIQLSYKLWPCGAMIVE